MSTLRFSGLRQSRLTNNVTSEDMIKPDRPSLAEFTKASHKKLLLAREDHKRKQNNTTNIEAAIDDTKPEENKEDAISMAQCISLLDPHITFFRDSCDTDAKQKSSKDNTASYDTEDEVPSQLLRLARFFPWRWVPIKKALLRPPPLDSDKEQEVEMSLTYRVRLAKACWKKGLLAAAEYELLCASFDSRKRGGDHLDGDGKRHKPDNLIERVRLALMRLPTEIATSERAMLAWRHVNEVLLEFCKSTNNSDKMGQTSIEQVADWTLTSWTALVLSQGMDASSVSTLNQNTSKNAIPAIEIQFADVLSNQDLSSGTYALAEAVAHRIEEVLTPYNLKSLNSLHIFALGRLFARFHSSDIAEECIARAIAHCSNMGGMVGMEQLSRLVATYSCSLSTASKEPHSDRGQPYANMVFGLGKRLLAKFDDSTSAKLNPEKTEDKSDHNTSNAQKESYLNVVLNAAAHLCRTPSR